MSFRDIRHKMLGPISSNAYIASSFYKILTSTETKDIAKLVIGLSETDTISDPYSLLDIKQRFERGALVHSRDKNFNNAMIYGYWKTLFPFVKDSGIPDSPAVEHGLILADDIYEEIKLTGRCVAVTFGSYRQDIIRQKAHIPAFSVGPYIQYATPFYPPDKFKAEKARLGKTLLVFPAHSTDDSEVARGVAGQLRQIDAMAANYDSVLISAFWWDLDDPILRTFENQGYRIVCAGFRDDPSFVSRQRTIIELSDAVLSDGVGTHIGFARTLSKPVAFIENGSAKKCGKWIKERLSSISLAESEIVAAVEHPGSNAEADALNRYWGLRISRTSDELRAISDISLEITRCSKGFRGKAWDVSMKLMHDYFERGEAVKASLLADALGSRDALTLR